MLDEDMLQAAVERALTQLRAGQARDVRRKSEIECELSQVETHISNMVDAIKRAKATESLLAGLDSEESRKKALLDERSRLGELEKMQSLETHKVANELSARFRDVKTLLGRHIPQSREMLKKILDGKFVCQPFQANDVRVYRFYASGTYGRLLCGEHVANDGRNPLGPPLIEHGAGITPPMIFLTTTPGGEPTRCQACRSSVWTVVVQTFVKNVG